MTSHPESPPGRGSIWRKWDLHVHTAASFHWKGKRLAEMEPTEQRAFWAAAVATMNESDVEVFGIQDYWTFEGYDSLAAYRNGEPTDPLRKLVLPGIELRLEAPTDYRLNIHLLFSDSVEAERRDEFIKALTLVGAEVAPTKSNLIAIARSLDDGKLKSAGCHPEDRNDEQKMLRAGYEIAVVKRESFRQALRRFDHQQCIVIGPYEPSDGLEKLHWEKHQLEDREFFHLVDVFESRKQAHVDLFLGIRTDENRNHIDDFIKNLGGYPKPVVSGSDAHELARYGVFPSGRATWLKGAASFRTLQHAMTSPESRCFIGTQPPAVARLHDNKIRTIDKVRVGRIDGVETAWFNQEIPINPGLVAVIGKKGMGKSALADIIALGGNAHCDSFSFLERSRFLRSENQPHEYEVRLHWAGGSPATQRLNNTPDTTKPERVHYVPQHYIEEICSELEAVGRTGFEQAINRVIFQHLDGALRQQATNLDEVVEDVQREKRRSLAALRAQIRSLNAQIVTAENGIWVGTVASLENELAQKDQEVEASADARPEPVAAPSDTQNGGKTAELNQAREKLEQSQARLVESRAVLQTAVANARKADRLGEAITRMRMDWERRKAELEELAIDLGLALDDLVLLRTNVQPLEQRLALENQVIREQRHLQESTGPDSLAHCINEAEQQVSALASELEKPAREYEQYKTRLANWQKKHDALVRERSALQRRVAETQRCRDVELPALLARRAELSREIYKAIVAEEHALEELFRPVQQHVRADPVAAELSLEFGVARSTFALTDKLLDMINRSRKGPFMGLEEGRHRLQKMIEMNGLSDFDTTLAFADTVLEELAGDPTVRAEIDKVLKATVERCDLYDLLYGFSYIRVRYELRYQGKGLAMLSPGERGALLLAFYLVVDKSDVPLVIDQPEHNLDNETIYGLLRPCFNAARARRQVIMVTHNPNLAVVCDADQIIRARFDREATAIRYDGGGLEDEGVTELALDVLEGTLPAFGARRHRYGWVSRK